MRMLVSLQARLCRACASRHRGATSELYGMLAAPGSRIFACARSARARPGNTLLQPVHRLLDQAEIGMLLDVDARLDEAHLRGGVDVALQSREVRHHVRV